MRHLGDGAIGLLMLGLVALVAACRSAPNPGGLAGPRGAPSAEAEPRSVDIGGMKVLELVTGGALPEEPLPLVFVLHGFGGAPTDWLPYFVRCPDKARFILPYGTRVGNGYVWYDDDPEHPTLAEPEEAADQLAGLIDAVGAARTTRGRAIITGYSQGAIVAFTLAVTHADRVSFVVPVSGALPTDLGPSAWPAGVPRPVVRAFHGSADETIPVAGARASIARLRALGFTADLAEYPVGHGTTRQEEQDFLRAVHAAVVAQP
jgi:phospholipase/carboxylesterase